MPAVARVPAYTWDSSGKNLRVGKSVNRAGLTQIMLDMAFGYRHPIETVLQGKEHKLKKRSLGLGQRQDLAEQRRKK